MKWFPHGLRIVVASGSMAAFLGGWVLLAHAGKPVSANPPPAIAGLEVAPLAPLPSLRPSAGIQALPSLRGGSTVPQLRLRTRGS
ncbi:MAG: hypothetical protein HY259_00185 [Chloroflexi bacterium]|nr:hypothetical protein [Chloroflexota bacterium]MBI3731871.1 hypothetical protein [Chloroflexota bacterium]